MSVWSRTLVAAATGVALLGAAGCGPGGLAGDTSTEASPPPTKKPLANVDPCTMLKPEDATAVGLEASGSPSESVSWQPGCDYRGEVITATVYKNMRETVSSAEKSSNWASFTRTEVNGRAAATAITKGSTQARVCNVMFNAGKATIVAQVSEFRDRGVDECAKALEIAKKIEPTVPEPA